MNDIINDDMFNKLLNGGPAPDSKEAIRKHQRATRRAMAINVVDAARNHAERDDEPFSQDEADVIMMIMELLDKVAAG